MNFKTIIVFVVIAVVEAGPLAYAGCIAGCAAMGPFAPACGQHVSLY